MYSKKILLLLLLFKKINTNYVLTITVLQKKIRTTHII